MRDIKSFLANLSHHSGIYQMLDDKGEVLYVGKAKDLKKRVSSYFKNNPTDLKTISLMKHTHHIDVTITNSDNEAVLLECNLIKKHRPRYNILLRDDKSYPYIFISNHPFPRIDSYRGPRKKNGLYFGPYPSSLAVRETINLMQKLFHLRTCRDSYYEARARPCLLYQIGRCTGPCVGLISKEEYAHNVQLAILFLQGKNHELIHVLQNKMENAVTHLNFELAAKYRDQIVRLRQIQDKQYVNTAKGNADIIGFANEAGQVAIQLLSIRGGQVLGSRSYYPKTPLHATQEEIMTAFVTQHYLSDASHIESIPKEIITEIALPDARLIENVLTEQSKHKVSLVRGLRGNKKKWLEMATTSAKQALSLHIFNKSHMQKRFISLQKLLQLNHIPKRLECFDISHTMGEATVASCVVFNENGPVKSDYRRFNIANIIPGDDIAAMHQVLSRRYKRIQNEEGKWPDVILIDGGKTQLAAAKSVMQELNLAEITLVGVSKGPGRKAGFETLHINEKAPIHLPADSEALHLIQQIRDEAHRFAITGHRARRDKTRRQSSLELIPGIGGKRRRELLRYFGGIQGIAHASLDELTKVPGINRSLAERIFAAFHDATI